jgi:hypothetical protein
MDCLLRFSCVFCDQQDPDIVESAAQSSSNAGELFAQLAEELSDPAERKYFLSII